VIRAGIAEGPPWLGGDLRGIAYDYQRL
jgi:hypothetical protein